MSPSSVYRCPNEVNEAQGISLSRTTGLQVSVYPVPLDGWIVCLARRTTEARRAPTLTRSQHLSSHFT